MGHFTRAGLLKRGIILFWSCWISTVVLMNVGDLLKVLGVLPADWKLASGNYKGIVRVTDVYGTPHWIDLLLLLGATCWEAISAVLFWWALRRYRVGHQRRWQAIYLAFTALLGLFGMFILVDEAFHAYRIQGDHRGIAILLLASLLAMQLLPEKAAG